MQQRDENHFRGPQSWDRPEGWPGEVGKDRQHPGGRWEMLGEPEGKSQNGPWK